MTSDDDAFKKLSPISKEWLSDTGSLTERLYKYIPDITFHVINDFENHVASKTHIRKIEWRLKEKTLIEAVVEIPDTSITPETNMLSTIGNTPIGKVLFTDPNLKRSDFLFYLEKNKWVRESVFTFKNKPLLVREIFLPAFFLCLHTT